jgi:hypothetical protein
VRELHGFFPFGRGSGPGPKKPAPRKKHDEGSHENKPNQRVVKTGAGWSWTPPREYFPSLKT